MKKEKGRGHHNGAYEDLLFKKILK